MNSTISPPSAAVTLLRRLHVTGSEADLAQAAQDYQHHALSLILLGRFLATARGGDIRQRDTISFEKANDKRSAHTRSAWHVLDMYEAWLASPGGYPRDLQALRLIGLFDRPASPDCLDSLRREPAIAGLTNLLVPLDRDDWNAVLHRLNEAHLIQLKRPPRVPGSHSPYPEPRSVPVDAHPLVREYFAKQLREKQPDGFADAHSRLFDHLCKSTPYRPNTLEGLQPLYQAVVHGCLAQKHGDAYELVYHDRILRGSESDGFYSWKQLGAVHSDLAAISAFFEKRWSEISNNLSPDQACFLFNEAAIRLQSIGRLNDALIPAGISSLMAQQLNDWLESSIRAGNLSQIQLAMGFLEQSLKSAKSALYFADMTGDWIERRDSNANVADALFHAGQKESSLEYFATAERIQKEHNPNDSHLSSIRGYQYCELIIANVETAFWRRLLFDQSLSINNLESTRIALANALQRSRYMISLRSGLLSSALGKLVLIRCKVYSAILLSDGLLPTLAEIDQLHNDFRDSADTEFLARFLLTSSLLNFLNSDPRSAIDDLQEVQIIAERGPMPLVLIDTCLNRARIAAMSSSFEQPRLLPEVDPKAELAKARALIQEHGYWRRREELADAEEAAKTW